MSDVLWSRRRASGLRAGGRDIMPAHSAGELSMQELSKYFSMPEKAVAKQLGVCLTSLKKICRQNGINRWPYRKVRPVLRAPCAPLKRAVFRRNGARAAVAVNSRPSRPSRRHLQPCPGP